MLFSEDQKDSLKSIFIERGFDCHKNGKFHFKGGVKTSLIKTFLTNLGSPDCFVGYPNLLDLERAINRGSIPVDDLMEVIKDFSFENKVSVPYLAVEESIEDVGGYLRALVPTVNISKGVTPQTKIILLDPSNSHRPVSGVDVESYLTIAGLTWKDLLLDPAVNKVFTCFDPYTLKYVFNRESKDGSFKNVLHVNFYVPPRWRFLEVAPHYGGFIKGLIDHLFPNEDEKEYVLDWMHYALVKRNETVLCLVGSRGTGKGILLNSVMSALIGGDYFSVAKQEVLTEKFNPEFDNKRFVFFDEVNISGDKELNKFKQLANAKISMEAKGEDSETIDNFVSMALSSNDRREFRAEPQERRISAPEVTEIPLLDVYSEEEVQEFCTEAANPESEVIAEFGNWLIQRKPENSNYRPLKGRYYFDLCKLSMYEWKVFILEYVLEHGEIGEEILIKDIDRAFKKGKDEKKEVSLPRSATIEIFLGDYIHEAEYKIGKIVESYDRNGRSCKAIVPNADFLTRFGGKYKQEESYDGL